jgi:hypothetical protein
MRPSVLLGMAKAAAPVQTTASAKPKPGQAVTVATSTPYVPTVEIIRGDKRETEVVK